MLAHNDGGVPNLIINIPELNEYCFGSLVYFFEKACGISGYILGVNPFDNQVLKHIRKICLHSLENQDMKKKRKT